MIRECEAPNSTAISSIRYDDTRKRLYVSFQNGGNYVYFGVSPQRFKAFCSAGSKGRYFQANIRNNYTYANASSVR